MARTAAEGFETFLGRLTPSESEREKASSHRASIYAKLDDRFGLYRMFESGSFKHGTGVSGKSDVDFFVSLKTSRPSLASSTLTSVKNALQDRFPSTYIHTSRPGVVLEFGGGYERVEVIPAYAQEKLSDGSMRFKIPGVTSEWLDSTPEAHFGYVNDSNSLPRRGAAKSLARLAKAWKYYRNVPISSFYLEMRAASYMRAQTYLDWPLDLYYFLNSLQSHELAAMNDPTGNTGRIEPCSSTTNKIDAKSKLDTAVNRALRAKDYYKDGRIRDAFDAWDLLFNGNFPAYY
ncbi:hypothetical protein SAMN05443575_3693 [Jatrophihabitans endophyticus]|uniref:Nucleotidyltransferase domain-containing protein n=1 Tax=Jatrophihabitans endophyticus TaxID=1206085 RepID=A0A1M5S0B4_9ACTN|nr:nucleotidyltransferase [Jatrophihabitans endophyticus]SHH31493.1 hypothetical protein SAMN05443575_3693 [Jatrophihabitans endophyticus]